MSKIITIFKRELASYFVSPVAYLAMTVFSLIIGYFYVVILFHAKDSNIMQYLFNNMAVVFLLLCPIITMNLINQDRQQGTDILLLTAPLTSWHIVLGKFFAAIAIYFIMLLLTVFYPVFLVIWGSPDLGPILTGYLGVFLLGSAFISVGLFSSSVTKTPVGSAVISFGVLLLLWIISWASGFLTSGMGEVFKNISVLDHFDSFIKGVLVFQDIAFYVLFIFFVVVYDF